MGQTLRSATQRVHARRHVRAARPGGDYWAGRPVLRRLRGRRRPRVRRPHASSLDAVFATRETVEAQGADARARPAVDRQLDLDRIRVTDVARAAAGARHLVDPDASGVQGDTARTVVLQQATAVVDALTLPVPVVEAQLLVLCWLVLFLVVANAAEARGPEVALAKLRGVGTGATVALRAARHRSCWWCSPSRSASGWRGRGPSAWRARSSRPASRSC